MFAQPAFGDSRPSGAPVALPFRGDGSVGRLRIVRELARHIEALNARTGALDAQIAAVLGRDGSDRAPSPLMSRRCRRRAA
jgi:hypothetical protein